MSVDYGNDYEYANAKLSDTIVSLKDGSPVYIDHVDIGDGTVSYRKLGGGDFKTTILSELDLKPLPLGNINMRDKVAYATRLPVRAWKQGLRVGSIYFKNASHARNGLMMDSPEFINCLIGNYPSLSRSLEALACGETKEMAFSRYFHIFGYNEKKKIVQLAFKGSEVGYGVIEDGLNLKLFDKAHFLRETLEEARNG